MVEECSRSQNSASATPMDVDAVGKGKGKGCFVCKDCKFNQAKGKAQGNGKAKNTPLDKNTPAKFEGECRHCSKKGRKWTDCRKRLAEAKNEKVPAIGEAPSTATVAAVEETEVIDGAGICGKSSNNKPVDAEFLPLDSACEEHTCPSNFGEGGRDLGPSNMQLRNANGLSIPSGRKVMVPHDVLGLGGRVILHAQTPFVQSDVKRPLLIVGKLTQSGAEVKFGSKGSWIDLQKRADLVRGLQGTPWDRLAGRPVGRPRKTAPQATPVATPPVAKETERSAKAEDLNRVPRATDTEKETRSSPSRPMETEAGGARDNTASDETPQAPVPARCIPMEQADTTGGQPVSSGVKRDPPDEDEQGAMFLHVEGLTTVDAEEIPCESSVEDDFLMDENTEGVNEEIVKTIVAGKQKELDAMEAFGIFDVCEKLPREAKVIITRWENVPKGDKWRCRFIARWFRHGDPEMEGLHT